MSVDFTHVQSWRISNLTGIDQLSLTTAALPHPARGQVAVAIHAVSLNSRDVQIVTGKYPGTVEKSGGGLIPCSDGAGEVVEAGEGVTSFRVGDRVAATFHANWESGQPHPAVGDAALGGNAHGTLTELALFDERGLVHLPAYLSFEEAATLPCAAVTAWTALRDTAWPIGPESIVLVQGTGGVSVVAAQLAVAAGSRVIATSSSDDKLAVYAKIGVAQSDLINYKTTPDWVAEVKRRAPNGVDHIVEVTGQLLSSTKCAKKGGIVNVIGHQTDTEAVTAKSLMGYAVDLRRLVVGSRRSFQDLLLAMEHHSIKPIVDRVFPFSGAQDAFHYLQSQKHVGKVVIAIK